MRKLLATALLLSPVLAHATITHVGDGAVDFQNAVDPVATLPTHTTGDLILCQTYMRSSNSKPTVSGYTEILAATPAGYQSYGWWAKIATSASETNPTFDYATPSNAMWAQCSTFRSDVGFPAVGSVLVESAQSNNSSAVDITYPNLTVSTNNTMVVVGAVKNDDFNGDNHSAISGYTESVDDSTLLASDGGVVTNYQIQTTKTNLTTGVWAGTSEAAAVSLSLAFTIKDNGAPAPTFSVAPAIGTRTTSTIPVTATTACTDCNYYGVAVTDGDSAPSCTQVKAGQRQNGSAAYKAFGPVAMTASVQNTGTFSTYTDGTVRDGYFCLNSTAGGDSTVSAIADMYKTPAASTPATVTSQTASAYTISKILDGPGSCTAVACAKDATAPTVAQVLAGHCTGDAAAIATVTDASCEAGTMTLGGSLTRYVHDIYWAGTYGSQNSSLTTLADEMLDAATGREIINGATGYTSIHANSPIVSFNASATPDIAAGDIGQCDDLTSPGGCDITYTATGLYSYPGSCGSTRQTFTCNFYDTSVGDLHADTMSVCVNNAAPVATPIVGSVILDKDVAMTAVDFSPYFADSDDVTLTYTSSDTGTGTGANKRPAGTSITAGVWSGTPTSTDSSTGSFTITGTDSCGATDMLDVMWIVYEQVAVPNCNALPLSTCITALGAVNLEYSFSSQCSATVPVLTVISQDPTASTVVSQFSNVSLVVSSGSCGTGRARRTLGVGVGVGRFTPESDFDSPF